MARNLNLYKVVYQIINSAKGYRKDALIVEHVAAASQAACSSTITGNLSLLTGESVDVLEITEHAHGIHT